ncbi:phospholipase [Pseudomonas sp. HR96]|uniref:phospholipase D-like domain-containing protein n=1 Tax=Pseudomonas sp. HR96 TaxID=1027966 RepID=UPI002A765777|nr:phospholipase [Pseudomonas sp. HR96]WPO97859.1 phospholipase [Pseudomonas sp. HR96]
MRQEDIVVPAVLSETNVAYCTAPWYIQRTEYNPALCTYQALVNGEETFRAVHLAIAAATKSVDIICWGFQPSMFFIRDYRAPSIGELLRSKAAAGVRVRVLGWEMFLNTAGFAGEANLPGKFPNLFGRALQNSTRQQHEYDRLWFFNHAVKDDKAAYRLGGNTPLFVSRGFNALERLKIGWEVGREAHDTEISAAMLNTLMSTATHHQKSVLVDYEDPERAVGFVMGHNMLDEYWDTDAHSALNRSTYDWPEPNGGARGFTPRQDISSKITGPILEHLHHNFAQAWKKETGEDLLQKRPVEALASQLKCAPGKLQMAQLLRTQVQEGARDIEQAYLQAVNNATQFIYIENQYFRWPPLAEAIKKAAADQTRAGRDPGLHGALHLFVVTNATDDGIGKGTVNTQRMLEALGRADTIPELTKLRRIEQLGKQQLSAEELAKKTKEIQNSHIEMEDVPGLKVHVCSLVAKDSPAGQPWMPVYIHSKLMIVNDVFTTHGSANINTRSMQVDSELNIAHEWVSVTTELRRRLWKLHAGEEGAGDDIEETFIAWEEIMKRNNKLMKERSAPSESLVEFHYDNATVWTWD